MERNRINHIIRTFFNKRFQERTRRIFGQWLCAPGMQKEKIEVMADIWKELPETATQQTYEDWKMVAQRINNRKFWQNSHTKSNKWWTYAAAVVLLIVSTSITFIVTKQLIPYKTTDMVEVFISYGNSQHILLPDGTKVWANPGSVLIYPEKFTADNRPVYLSGEATFDVISDSDKPFYVKTHYIDVEVIGTVFTVKSYPNEYFTTATLEKGNINVAIKNKASEHYKLLPGEQLVYLHREDSSYIHAIDMDIYRMEREGFLIFENAPIRDIFVALERKYNVTFHYDTSLYKHQKYNVKFIPGETLNEAIEVLRQLTGMNYTIRGSFIYINNNRR